MKNILLIILIFLFVSSCEKAKTHQEEDLCTNITCLNGGECIDGSCDCAPNYTGESCETIINECYGVTCLNQGICVSGICDCPTGYTGVYCQTLLFPDSFKIHRIEVNYFYGTSNFGLKYLIENTEYFSLYPFEIDLSNGDDYHEFFTPVTIPLSRNMVMRFQYINYNNTVLGEKSINPLIDPLPSFTKVNGNIYKVPIIKNNGDIYQNGGEFSIIAYGELIYL